MNDLDIQPELFESPLRHFHKCGNALNGYDSAMDADALLENRRLPSGPHADIENLLTPSGA